MFNSKYLIHFLNEKWQVVKTQKLKSIPRTNEFVYFDDLKTYYRVVCVVHQMTKKHDILVVIKEFSLKTQEN